MFYDVVSLGTTKCGQRAEFKYLGPHLTYEQLLEIMHPVEANLFGEWRGPRAKKRETTSEKPTKTVMFPEQISKNHGLCCTKCDQNVPGRVCKRTSCVQNHPFSPGCVDRAPCELDWGLSCLGDVWKRYVSSTPETEYTSTVQTKGNVPRVHFVSSFSI